MLERQDVTRFLAGALLAALAACAVPPQSRAPVAPSPQAPPVLSRATSYEVTTSEVTVRVYRDGPLAALGHNHVIASTALRGRIELREPVGASTLALVLPLDSLTVDEKSRRLAAGEDFPDNLTEADREGTRRNMLGPALLDAARFPQLRLTAAGVEGNAGDLLLTVRVELAGAGHEVSVPASLELTGEELVASGAFMLRHSDIGLTPFSAALGALRVREDMLVGYRLVARRTGT